MSLKCPRCGLFNVDTAQQCDCGYDFEAKSVKKSDMSGLGKSRRLQWAVRMTAASVLLAFVSYKILLADSYLAGISSLTSIAAISFVVLVVVLSSLALRMGEGKQSRKS